MKALDEDSDECLPYVQADNEHINNGYNNNQSARQQQSIVSQNLSYTYNQTSSQPSGEQMSVVNLSADIYPRLTGIWKLVFKILVIITTCFLMLSNFIQYFFLKSYQEIVFTSAQIVVLFLLTLLQCNLQMIKAIFLKNLVFVTTEIGIIIVLFLFILMYQYNFVTVVPILGGCLYIFGVLIIVALIILYILVLVLKK